jgi:hypothetical protein
MGSVEHDALSDLCRRREELSAQVAKLHWDLGGLAYEMAIRDHFRLDVLVRRAAELQERDAELAELERLISGTSEAPETTPPSTAGHSSLPGPGVAAVLVLVMLGFGVLVGNVARGAPQAHKPRPLTLMMAAAGGTSPTGSTTTRATLSSSSAPPPLPSEVTPTPSAAKQTTSPDTAGEASESTPASKPAVKTTSAKSAPTATPKSTLPAIKHVFLITLANQAYASTFGPSSAAPYLSGTLEKRGELLVRYYAVARDELANEIAMVSGLGPTADNAVNCPTFSDVIPAAEAKDGQFTGNGCVYPSSVKTVGDQLAAKNLTWRAYAEDMERGTPGTPEACRHPAFDTADTTTQARPGDAFATFRDPFSYFDSVIDAPGCGKEDVGLKALTADLADVRRTPALSYIVPNLCHDGRETPCVPGAPAGLPAADTFLEGVVPKILASTAYKQGGLLVITTDQAPPSGPNEDSSSCCAQPRFPGIPGNQPTGPLASNPDLPAPGGGQVGALLLSPFIKAHTVDQEPFNHFSLLRTIEDIFGLSHLGYAGLKGVSSFGAAVLSGSGSE